MKVALIQTPFWGISGPPLGIACLSAYIRERGYDVFKLDMNVEAYAVLKSRGVADLWRLNQPMWGNFDQVTAFFNSHKDVFDGFVDQIIRSEARVIGFSILWSTEMISRLIATEIKRRDPSRVIVFGGPQCAPGVSCENLVNLPDVDFVIQGEGEDAFFELLERINSGRPTANILSVMSKTDKTATARALIRDMDGLPFADFDDFRLDLYLQPVTLSVASSRGCPNKCYYCNEKAFWLTFRAFSGERIFEEVRYQVERHGIRRFEFTDSLVNGKVKTLERFCDLVIANGLDIQWMGQSVVRKEMEVPLLRKIKDSGCFHLCFGMEHSSVPFMMQVGKILSKNTDVDTFIRNCNEVGLPMGLNWMFGFPGESEADFEADLDFFTRNSRYFGNVSVNNSPGFCGFAPGSYGHDHPDELDIVLGPDGSTWKSRDGTNTYVTRLTRYQKFCRHLDGLGISYSFPALDNEDELIGNYYFDIEKDYATALEYFKKEARRQTSSVALRERVAKCAEILKAQGDGNTFYVLPDCSDQNWIKGVAIKWAAAFFVPDSPAARRDFRAGNQVMFADGSRRDIKEQKENAGSLIVFVEGQPLDGQIVGYPNMVTIMTAAPSPPL